MKRIFLIMAVAVVSANAFAQDVSVPTVPTVPTVPAMSGHHCEGEHKCEGQECKGEHQCQHQCHAVADSIIVFKDEGLKFYCLHAADRNQDGEISYNEAAMCKEINCEYGGRRALRYIQDYDDLKYFINVEKLFLGVSNVKELDLTYNRQLKLINMNALDELDFILLYEGCKPEIVYPLSKQDKGVTIIYKKDQVIQELE